MQTSTKSKLHITNGHEDEHMFQNFNLAQCDAYLEFKCHENDVAMPKLVGERREHGIKVMQHISLISFPCSNDVNDDGTGDSSLDLDFINVLRGRSWSMMDVSVNKYAL